MNVEAALLGDDGKPLLDTTISIGPGQSFSTELGYSCCQGAGLASSCAAWSVLSDPSGKTNLNQVVANLEVFDDKSGTTSMILPYILLPAVQTGPAGEWSGPGPLSNLQIIQESLRS